MKLIYIEISGQNDVKYLCEMLVSGKNVLTAGGRPDLLGLKQDLIICTDPEITGVCDASINESHFYSTIGDLMQ